MSPALLNKIPEEVREHVKMLLSVTPTVRPDADQMTKVCVLGEAAFMEVKENISLEYVDYNGVYVALRSHFLMTWVR